MITNWRKLYNSPAQGEESNAIITYSKEEHKVTWVPVDKNALVTFSYSRIRFVNQYEKRLILDLWIARLHFNWLTKYRESE